MKKIILSFGLLLSACAFAGTLAVDQFNIDGGGGTSSGGSFSITSTAGQPDAGKMSGGNFGVQGSFWSLFSVVPMPGAPDLKITLSGSTAILSWSVAAETFQLQSSSDLSVAHGWASVSQTATTNNGTVSVAIPATPGSLFFRLKNSAEILGQ